MPVVKEAEKKVPVVPIAIGIGAVGMFTGLFLFLRKPPGVSPGGTVRVHFKFDYSAPIAGHYVLLVRFGYHRLPFWFDPEEGMDRYMLEVFLPRLGTYEYDLDCVIPDGAPKRTYDAEGSILTLAMVPGKDWALRVFKDKAITVR